MSHKIYTPLARLVVRGRVGGTRFVPARHRRLITPTAQLSRARPRPSRTISLPALSPTSSPNQKRACARCHNASPRRKSPRPRAVFGPPPKPSFSPSPPPPHATTMYNNFLTTSVNNRGRANSRANPLKQATYAEISLKFFGLKEPFFGCSLRPKTTSLTFFEAKE